MQSRLPTPLRRINLNGIRPEEISEYQQLLDRSGVSVPDLDDIICECRDFREVVVRLYDHEDIKTKIKGELTPLLQNTDFRKVFVASHLLKWSGQEVDAAFLRAVTQCDAYAVMHNVREISTDLFRLDDDDVQVRSSIFSEYVIQNHIDSDDLIECTYSIIIEAVKRKSERRYQAVLSSLIRYSKLDEALKKDPHRSGALQNLFNRLCRDIGVNQEPLFWLQYSILMTAAGDLEAAERFIDTAYKRAKSSPGFQTYQIDTYALRLLLLIEQRAAHSATVIHFAKIIEKLERVRSMIGDESHRFHALQVLDGIEPFVLARLSSFSTAEMNLLVYHLSLVIDQLEKLSADERAYSDADRLKASVVRAKAHILANSQVNV